MTAWPEMVKTMYEALKEIADGGASLRLRDENCARYIAQDAIVAASEKVYIPDEWAQVAVDVCHHLGVMTCYAMLRSHHQLREPIEHARRQAELFRIIGRPDLAEMVEHAIFKSSAKAGQIVDDPLSAASPVEIPQTTEEV